MSRQTFVAWKVFFTFITFVLLMLPSIDQIIRCKITFVTFIHQLSLFVMFKRMLLELNIQLAFIVALTGICNHINFFSFVLNFCMLTLCMTIHIVTALVCRVTMLTFFLLLVWYFSMWPKTSSRVKPRNSSMGMNTFFLALTHLSKTPSVRRICSVFCLVFFQ